MSPWLADSLLSVAEAAFAAVPRRRPHPSAVARAQIVSHRGERDNKIVFENTFAAFDTLIEAGVWGIEFDVRFTRDLQPVVIHDLDLLRVFGQNLSVAALELDALRRRQPLIPTLSELIERYCDRLHLMIELKAGHPDNPRGVRTMLEKALAPLRPGQDYHVLSMNPDLFELAQNLPHHCWLPVARSNIAATSAFALAQGCAGFAGPYALIRQADIDRHQAAGQDVGVGFPAHRNVLYREVKRGVRWLFSNRALRLQELLDRAKT